MKLGNSNIVTSRIGVHFNENYELHETGPFHPESAGRYRVLRMALEKLPEEILRLPGRRAAEEEVLLVHDRGYLESVIQDCKSFVEVLRTGDTAICRESYEVALAATGAVLEAVDAVMRGEVISAFCAVRPPGHHATAMQGMGFCILNHVAAAARHLQARHGVGKIAIIDWDVHHGNGTESVFLEDSSVFYVSLHQKNIYPFTGAASEHGQGAGLGATLNIPLPGDSDGSHALEQWTERLEPALAAYAPEFLLISAGFDARMDDPIGGLRWDDGTFAEMTRRAVVLAERFCQGRIVSVLEGGYNPAGLASAAVEHVYALAAR